jgi:hypothetical protein
MTITCLLTFSRKRSIPCEALSPWRQTKPTGAALFTNSIPAESISTARKRCRRYEATWFRHSKISHPNRSDVISDTAVFPQSKHHRAARTPNARSVKFRPFLRPRPTPSYGYGYRPLDAEPDLRPGARPHYPQAPLRSRCAGQSIASGQERHCILLRHQIPETGALCQSASSLFAQVLPIHAAG